MTVVFEKEEEDEVDGIRAAGGIGLKLSLVAHSICTVSPSCVCQELMAEWIRTSFSI